MAETPIQKKRRELNEELAALEKKSDAFGRESQKLKARSRLLSDREARKALLSPQEQRNLAKDHQSLSEELAQTSQAWIKVLNRIEAIERELRTLKP